MKDKHFIDWESDIFGFGYGSGEQFTLAALKEFLQLCNRDNDSDDKYPLSCGCYRIWHKS